MENRYAWVDCAKAIGIFLVVFGHVLRGLFSAGLVSDEPVYQLVDSVIYSFHMPLFFFLSGLFFMESLQKKGLTYFTMSKLDSIIYPYVLWSLIQGLIEAFLSNYTNGRVTYGEVFELLWQPRAQFWFLYALFFVSMFSAVIFNLISSRWLFPIFCLSIIGYFFQNNYEGIIHSGYLLKYEVFFVLGIIFKINDSNFNLENWIIFASLFLLFCISQYIFHCVLGFNYNDKGFYSLLIAIIAILFVTSFSMLLSRVPTTIFVFIGQSSMAIYVMHILACSGSRIIISNFMGVSSIFVHLLVGFVVGILAPIVALHVIRRFSVPYVFSAPLSKMLVK